MPPALLALFLVGAPLLSVAAVHWVGRAAVAGQRAEHSRYRVAAVLLQAAPPPAVDAGVVSYAQAPARWKAPDGRARTGKIPVGAGLAAGRTVQLWVDPAGSPTMPPLTRRVLLVNQVTAAVGATATLGIGLLCLAWAGRRALDRRRLAAWEAAWAAVGPQWTRRFRSRG